MNRQRFTIAHECGHLHLHAGAGERLCTAYEIFREWEPSSDMEFDQAALLARGAASSEDIELFRCLHCQSAMLIDKWARRREVCSGCRGRRSASP